MRLTKEDLIEIANMIEQGYGAGIISKKFNYSQGSTSHIIKRYKEHGIEGLLHKADNRKFTVEEKIAIINRYYSGESKASLAAEINVNIGVICSWVKKYEELGYNGLKDNRGRPGETKMGRPKKNQTKENKQIVVPLTDKEREELNELRKKVRRLEMEIEATKKLDALVQERINRQTRKKQ